MRRYLKKRFFLVFTIIAILLAVVSYLRNTRRIQTPHPNVLLITVDALRADHLGCYGYQLETSPNIDRLANRGARFTDCTVQWPVTCPSMASLMTGNYPKNIGMRTKRSGLPPSLKVMSEIFKEAGYTTGAVIANFNIGKTFGFDQGFDNFVESWQEKWKEEAGQIPFRNLPGRVKHYTNATLVTDQGLKWLRQVDTVQPFFLWLHYMDPHGPYVPPEEYLVYFGRAYTSPIPLEKLPSYQIQKKGDSDEAILDLAFYKTQYDREIRYLDDEIDRLLTSLAKTGLDTNTLIILTADHGESLGEHEYYLGHGRFSYQACAHVPLIFVHDGFIPEGETFRHPVGLIDVSATIIDLAGIEIPPSFQGQSLAGLIKGNEKASSPRFVFMESGSHQTQPQLTIRYDRWKLIHVKSPKEQVIMAGTEFELYDVYKDPQEVNNIASKHPELVKQLSKILDHWFSSGPRIMGDVEEIKLESLDEKSVEMLRSLGYIK